MKKIKVFTSILMGAVLIVLIFNSCDSNNISDSHEELKNLRNQLSEIAKSNETIAKHLRTFDTLDFVVYSNQDWLRLHESHGKDILVHYPDGHTTKGIEDHIKELEPMFVFAPDTRIEEHPIKFGSGNLTAVTGELLGTFTKPMPVGGGEFIQPTGKSFKLPMCTIGLWNEEGVMYEEFLYWDNQAFMKQIGLTN